MQKSNMLCRSLSIVALLCGLFWGFLICAEENYHYDDYKLSSGDKISIQVYDESDLDLEVLLDSSGNIAYHMLGLVPYDGLTVKELKKTLTDKLSGGYLIDPKVSVSIVEYRPFYVDGEVNQPGAYPYVPRLDVRKAVTIAGGFTDRASKKYFEVRSETGAVEKKANISAKIFPGDSITVHDTFF